MKTLQTAIGALLLLVLSSCHDTVEPLYTPQQCAQLNTTIAPWQQDNDLLPWKGQYYTMVINSIDDVYATQTARFIEENPNWLQVDFATKSIIAVRTIMFAYDLWQYTAVSDFSQVNFDDEPINYSNGDYQLTLQVNYSSLPDTEYEDESQYRIYQIALVTNKIPTGSQVHVRWSTSSSTQAAE